MQPWLDTIPLVAIHYVLTLTATSSYIGDYLIKPLTSRVDRLVGYEFSACRLCVGFWIALGIGIATHSNALWIWGASQILTQFEPKDG